MDISDAICTFEVLVCKNKTSLSVAKGGGIVPASVQGGEESPVLRTFYEIKFPCLKMLWGK